ncbi:hypothetical protein BDN70DRAFT_875291 [Pholiota conissans]|uniref:Coenzyme Q-binding protein COQ10 START domain-containing protein n=1 Tax=Pholiota conissans TaxID=109636 RepID=A0A9P6D3K3_9AGAR|nr:hypothetical protein BDN70DRAFT_875291 [Pholiota conissans]
MIARSFAFVGVLYATYSAFGQTPPTNLPPATPGVFSAQSSIIIDGPIETVWSALLDFPAYPNWNPFVRWVHSLHRILLEALTDQTPHENLRLIIAAQIPPLPTPVDASTPPNLLHAQLSFENITAVDTAQHRVAWKEIMIPAPLLSAERWQALSVVNGNQTFYEAREVFGGPVGYVVDALFAQGLQAGFDAQAEALKELVER